MQVTTIGLDIAKNVFQVHGIDANLLNDLAEIPCLVMPGFALPESVAAGRRR
jgi:hypothetical protein